MVSRRRPTNGEAEAANKFIVRYMPIRPPQPFKRQHHQSGYHSTNVLFRAELITNQSCISSAIFISLARDCTGETMRAGIFLLPSEHPFPDALCAAICSSSCAATSRLQMVNNHFEYHINPARDQIYCTRHAREFRRHSQASREPRA